MIRAVALFFLIYTSSFIAYSQPPAIKPGWPEVRRETKPWTRWWWQGSAVSKEGLTAELESFQQAGLGGVEITPIYGVYGEEEKFVNYLSPEWMELFLHVLKECERLDLGVDMATGTGWPFGGPWITAEDACKNFEHKVYEVKGGASLQEKIEFIQQPYVRAIGPLVFERNDKDNARLKDGLSAFDSKTIGIKSIIDPIEKNDHLQSYAFDQVQFEKPLKLQVLVAYNERGEATDLTSLVDTQGYLQWQAPAGNWKLYAVFEGWHGKIVERAAPGGEGNVIDHFSAKALQHYLEYFDKALNGRDIKTLRAFFNDSYEVDDAKGAADWTPVLFDEFTKRRGYDLRQHLPALFGHDAEDKSKRVLSDYRETISEMLADNFTRQWKAWAAKHSAVIRNQAHGSPANILDLYSIVDIPEIEGTEPLRMKMASSAGNIMGKRLISAESATWLDEHFMSGLHQIKDALDQFMLQGVNHLFYHGTAYSPVDEPWPGWLFYAAVHLNSRNPQWKDFGTLNTYVARCQSFLQQAKPDNDILLYYPIYDRFATRGPEMIEHFDGIGKQFEGSSFALTAETLHQRGFMFDYISDLQIRNLAAEKGEMITEGKAHYKTLVIPQCEFMPLSTLEKIEALVKAGAKVIFIKNIPKSFSGYASRQVSAEQFQKVTQSIASLVSKKSADVVDTNGLEASLNMITPRETTNDLKLACIRKKQEDDTRLYFINNGNEAPFEGWVTLQSEARAVVAYDPMTGVYGKAKMRKMGSNRSEVYLQMQAKQSLILQFYRKDIGIGDLTNVQKNAATPLRGPWQLTFISGGPELPSELKQENLAPWTTLGEQYRNFSGTCSYRINFARPQSRARQYLLDLGEVKESAAVFLNGKYCGTVIGPVYNLQINGDVLKDSNVLEIQVSNLMANRIAYMDRNKIFWKKFYNVNFPARKPENRLNNIFDASHWQPQASGLIGPVVLFSLEEKKVN